MMYQSDGSQNKKDPNVFLGNFAEEIIREIRSGRERRPGDFALAGKPGQEIKDRSENYT